MDKIKKFSVIVVLLLMSGIYAGAQTTGVKIGAVHPDLKIKITRCEAAGKTVVIDLVFENVGGNDADLTIVGGDSNKSVAYDDEGNVISYGLFKVKLGNTDLSKWSVAQTLPAGVPIKGRIQIEGVQESATKFSRINLMMSSGAWGFRDKISKISNVPISREGD